jgi:small-conductance mechanosensitive channel
MQGLMERLFTEFHSAEAWVDLMAVLLVLLLAYGAARWLQKRYLSPESDTPFVGQSEISGVLFPVLAWFLLILLSHLANFERDMPLHRLMTELFGSLALLRLMLMVQVMVFNRTPVSFYGQKLLTAGAWLLALMWSFGLIPTLLVALDKVAFKMGHTTLNLGNLLEAVFSCLVVMTFALGAARFIEARVINRFVLDLSVRRICANLSGTACVAVGVLICLSIFGVDVTTLSVLGGGLGVGVGLGLQKLASNYVSGFVILLEGAIQIGDTVKVDGVEGRVVDIKTRYTLIDLPNGKEFLVPNESLVSQRVENLTQYDQNFALTTSVVVPQDVDVDQVCALMCQAALSQERVLRTPEPVTFLSGFEARGLQMTLNFWIADPAKGKDNILSAVNFEILNRLRQARITLPAPQYKVVMEGGAEPAVPSRAVKASAKTPASPPTNPPLF